MGGTNWVRNVLLTTALFCGPLLVMFAFLNTVAIVYRTTAALPFGTICIILVIWALITFPLTVLGGIAGKNSKARALPPSCSTLAWCPAHVRSFAPAQLQYSGLVPGTRALLCSAHHPDGEQIYRPGCTLHGMKAAVWRTHDAPKGPERPARGLRLSMVPSTLIPLDHKPTRLRADGVQRAVPDDQVPARGAAAALVPPGAAADGHGWCAHPFSGWRV